MLVSGSLYAPAFENERRQAKREDTDLPATAITGDGLIRIELRIVNLSRTGAMLELEEQVDLLNGFVLLFEHRAEPCQLVWQRGNIAGVQFVESVG
jgi:hypothetical protein